MTHRLKAMCHTDGLLWSTKEIASMALPVVRERHAKNVWHIASRQSETHSMYLSCSAGSATEAISFVLHTVNLALKNIFELMN